MLGTITFPRLTFEIMYQNGIKPFIQGAESGNYRQSYKGFKTMLMAMAGSRAARWLLYAITGRVAYGIADTIFRYTPPAPGLSKVQQMFDDVNGTLRRAQQNDEPIPKTAGIILGQVSGQLEMFIPFCDIALDYYETQNDVYGVRLYSLLKKDARSAWKLQTGSKFSEASRSDNERIQHMFWGG
ncbi:unnamed protein product, partial [marine sediment metagenome]